MRAKTATLVAFGLAFGSPGCGGTDIHPQPPPGRELASITLTSKSFASGAAVPVDYTCDGKETSPQLTWSAPPEGTKSLAILLEDSDATSRTHWFVFNLPPETTSLAEGVDVGSVGGKLGATDFGDVRYAGPCPPRRELHRYTFHVLAVDTTLALPDGSRRAAIDAKLNGHLIGEGTLMGQAGR